MHHEVFLALLGHAGDVVEARPEGFFVRREVAFLTPPQKTMLNRLLTLGHAFATLDAFVRNAVHMPSIYVRGLAQGMDRFLQQYADAVVGLETKILATKAVFPIPQMVYELEEYMELLPELSKLVRKIQVADEMQPSKCVGGAQLLDLLYRMTSSGFPRIRKSMQDLLFNSNRILFKQILAWILYGEIVDPYNEFFVRKSTPSASGADHDHIGGNDDDDALTWYKQFSIDLDSVPLAYFPVSVAESILFIGKSMQILVKANEYSIDEAQELIGAVASLAQNRVFDAVAVEHAMESVRLHIAARLYKEVVVKSKFVDYFKSLKGFFLLSRGELFQAFIERSYTMMTMKPSYKSEEDLNHLIWQQTIRELEGENIDDSWSQQFTIQVCFSSVEGLQLRNVSRDASSKSLEMLELDGDEALASSATLNSDEKCGVAWWKHVQYDASAFSSEFSIDLVGQSFPTNNDRRRLALLFKNDGSFVTPSVVDGTFKIDEPQAAFVSVECEIETASDTGEVTIVAQIKASKAQDEEARVSSKVLIPTDSTSDTNSNRLHFQLQYARQEFKSAISNQVMYKKILLLTVNGVVVMETKFDFQQALYLQASSGEYWVGLAMTPRLRLAEWSLDKYSPKASWRPGSTLKEQNPSLSPRELWNYMSLRCDVQWPLQLLITKDVMRSYAHLFQFCFRLKRVAHGLERTWKSGAFRAKKNATTAEDRFFSQACALRSRMGFVIRNIELYFQVFVIETSFSKCLSEIEEASDFDKVKRIHDGFVAGLVKKCYLHTRTVFSAVEEVIHCCWKFVEYVLCQDAAGLSLSADRITVLGQEFRTRFDFFYGVLQHSEARDLIFMLDYNEFFSTEREEMVERQRKVVSAYPFQLAFSSKDRVVVTVAKSSMSPLRSVKMNSSAMVSPRDLRTPRKSLTPDTADSRASGGIRDGKAQSQQQVKAALKKRSNALANLQPAATGGLPVDKRKTIHAAPDSTWEVLRHLLGTPQSGTGTANPGKQALIAELVHKTNFSTQSIFQMSRKFKLIAGSSKNVISFDEFRQIMSDDVGDLLTSIGIGGQEFEELQNTDMTAIGATISSSETFLRRLFLTFDADGDGKIDFREFVVGLNGFVKGTPEEKVHVLFEIYKSDSSDKETVAISDLLGLFQGDRHLYQELMRCVDEYFARVELRDELQPTMKEEEFVAASIAEPHLLDMVSRPILSRKYAAEAHVREKIRAYIEQKQLNWKKLLHIHRRILEYARGGSTTTATQRRSSLEADLQERVGSPPDPQQDPADSVPQLQEGQSSINSQTLAIPVADFHRILSECLGPSALEDEALMQSILLAYVAMPREKLVTPRTPATPSSNLNPRARMDSLSAGVTLPPNELMARRASMSFSATKDNYVAHVSCGEFSQDIAVALQTALTAENDADSKARYYFELYDMNGDGYLSRSELCTAICAGLGHFGQSMMEVVRILEDEDSDQDGEITKDEYMRAANKSPLILAPLYTCLWREF
ncbi:Gamma-tubulin complex component 4, partial [Globisporangium splendens]